MQGRSQWAIVVAAMAATGGLMAWASPEPGFYAARAQGAEAFLQAGAILTARDAYVLMPPEMVSGPRVGQRAVSPNGVHLLVERHTTLRTPVPGDPTSAAGEVSLSVWDFSTRRGATLWRDSSTQKDPLGDNWSRGVRQIEWLPTTNLALVLITEDAEGATRNDASPQRLIVVDAARRTVRPLLAGTNEDALLVAPTKPVAAYFSATAQTLAVIGADGVARRTWNITENHLFWLGWQEEGKTLYAMRIQRDVPPGEKPKREQFLFDVTTGQLSPFTGKHAYTEPALPTLPPLKLTHGEGEVRQGKETVRLSPLWLEGADPEMEGRALVTPDGANGGILPRAVLFESRGSLYAAPIVKMERATYLTLRQAVLKRLTMNQAKQIGLAMIMYAQDYDDNLPPVGSDLKGIVNPYLKNDSVWNNPASAQFGFTPAYKTVGLSSYDTPATTPLGYLTGPGGRAVIYVDGHVKWEDGP